MATFLIDYGSHGAKIVAAFSRAYNYQAEIDDGNGNLIPNPESAADMTKRKVLEFIKNTVKANSDVVAAARDTFEAAKEADAVENDSFTIE